MIIFDGKCHAFIIYRYNPAIGYGDPVSVVREIFDYCQRAGESSFSISVPIFRVTLIQEFLKSLWILVAAVFALKLEFVLNIQLLEIK